MAADNSSKAGYDVSIFVSKPSEQFSCALCLNILNDPRQCTNGHGFCFSCISAALAKKSSCPICNVHLVAGKLVRNLIVKSLVDEMQTICPSRTSTLSHASDSCDWIGPLCTRSNHFENDCGYFLVKCFNNGCNQAMERRLLQDHKEVCSFRRIPCEFCKDSQVYLAKELEKHAKICEHRPVSCANGCSVVVPFNQLGNHLQVDCPLQLVDCPLKALLGVCRYDCPGKMSRAALEEHVVGPDSLYRTVLSIAEPFVSLRSDLVDLSQAQQRTDSHLMGITGQFDNLIPLIIGSNGLISDVKSLTTVCRELSKNSASHNNTLTLQSQTNEAVADAISKQNVTIQSFRDENQSAIQNLTVRDQVMSQMVQKLNKELNTMISDNDSLASRLAEQKELTSSLMSTCASLSSDVMRLEKERKDDCISNSQNIAELRRWFTENFVSLTDRMHALTSNNNTQNTELYRIGAELNISKNAQDKTDKAFVEMSQNVASVLAEMRSVQSKHLGAPSIEGRDDRDAIDRNCEEVQDYHTDDEERDERIDAYRDVNHRYYVSAKQHEVVSKTRVIVNGGCEDCVRGWYRFDCYQLYGVGRVGAHFVLRKERETVYLGADEGVWKIGVTNEVNGAKSKGHLCENHSDADQQSRLMPPTSGWVCTKTAPHDCVPLRIDFRHPPTENDDWMYLQEAPSEEERGREKEEFLEKVK